MSVRLRDRRTNLGKGLRPGDVLELSEVLKLGLGDLGARDSTDLLVGNALRLLGKEGCRRRVATAEVKGLCAAVLRVGVVVFALIVDAVDRVPEEQGVGHILRRFCKPGRQDPYEQYGGHPAKRHPKDCTTGRSRRASLDGPRRREAPYSWEISWAARRSHGGGPKE